MKDIGLDFISYLEEEGIYILNEELTGIDNDTLSEWYEPTLNEEIYEFLPLDVTDVLMELSEEYDEDVDDIIDSLNCVKIEPEDIGIVHSFDIITLSFVINEIDGRYYLTNIELL